MTAAAVILAATPESALADAAGLPSVRRITDAAWAGGAVPIVVVSADPDGAVARALAGSPALVAPPAPAEQGPVGQIVQGCTVAVEQVSGTSAALVWPARLTWVDAETVTSLIEAHGVEPSTLLRPTADGTPGWPVLLPLDQVERLRTLSAGRMPDEVIEDLVSIGVPTREIEVGDSGVTHDRSTPLDELPAYSGPPEPAGGPPPDWGPSVADHEDETVLQGPGLAPFGQGAAEDRD